MTKKAAGYTLAPATQIKPLGWMKKQLRIQANGLAGNLDKVWPDVRDSRWVGGDREGWERVPYWLDGFIPLAYLLHDKDMIGRAKFYIDNILTRQQADGWICPCTPEERPGYDMWAGILISKVLVVYYEFSHDERVVDALERFLDCMADHLVKYPLRDWGKYRWFEALFAIRFLYERTGKEKYLKLAVLLHDQGFDWPAYYGPDWPEKEARPKWTMESHVVNTAMMLKGETLYKALSGDEDTGSAEAMYRMLMKYHGTSAGHFTGDECLAGKDPTHGAELCSIAEAMFSYETLFYETGDPVWLDRAERLAFNSLPATLSADMWTHQYDQQINQIACTDQYANHAYMTNLGQSGLFGLEPNFGCCTANFGQAFPKFTMSAWGVAEHGILSALLIPSVLDTKAGGARVRVTLSTDYPFRDELNYEIKVSKPVKLTFSIRIPKWAGKTVVSVGGHETVAESGRIFSIKQTFKDTTVVTVKMHPQPLLLHSEKNLWHVERGALTFALPLDFYAVKHEYTKDGVERTYPYCDYSIYPVSPWNYAFSPSESGMADCEVSFAPVLDHPFSKTQAPVRIGIKAVHIPWNTKAGQPFVCDAYPSKTTPISEPKTVYLVPYGSTILRMTDLPIAKALDGKEEQGS